MLQCVEGEPVQLIKGRTGQERNVLGATYDYFADIILGGHSHCNPGLN